MMDEKQLEALRAELEELKQGNEALKQKNTELISEKRKLQAKSGDSVDVAKYEEALSEIERLKSENEKVVKTYKTETEKLTKALTDKDGALQKLIIDDGLNAQLLKVGVKPEMMEIVKKALRNDVSLKDDNGNFLAVVGDKPLNEFIESEWLPTIGQHFISAPSNSGTGAGGSKQGGGKEDSKPVNLGEMYEGMFANKS